MDIDDFFMGEALKLALQAQAEGEIPIGALIVGGDSILAKGYNSTEKLKDVTAHAEILALTAASWHLGNKYLKNCTLYVTLEPCPMCAAALAWSQIGRIVYGATDVKRGYSLFTPSLMHSKTEIIKGIREEECGKLMTEFFKSKR